MAREFTKQDAANLAANARPVLEKLNQCHSFSRDLDKDISKVFASGGFLRRCRSLITLDVGNSSSFTDVKDIVSTFSDLFRLLYLKQQYLDVADTVERLYQHYYMDADLYTALFSLNDVPDGLAWTFAGSVRKKDIVRNYGLVQNFMNSGHRQLIEEIYNRLYNPSSYTTDDMTAAYRKYRSSWFDYARSMLSDQTHAGSKFIKNCDVLLQRFRPVVSQRFDDDDFDHEIEKFRSYIQVFIFRETTVDTNLDFYAELEKLPLEELNHDKSGIRISALASHGFKTIADLYRAPVQTIYSVKGISEDTAYKIKHKVDEMARLVQTSDKTTTTEPLKINYDNRTEDTTNIVKAVYNCRKLLMVKKRFAQMGPLDSHIVKQAVSILENVRYDCDWLFFTERSKVNIVKAYGYLEDLLNDDRYKNYRWFFRYSFDGIKNVSGSEAWDDFRDNPVAYNNCIEYLVPNAFEDVAFGYGLPEELAEQIEQEIVYPKGLTCELRRYQVWGVKYILRQRRSMLGDEMGLGKTVQAIAAMVSLKNVGFNLFLVICPASVVVNWFKEVRQHSKLQAYIGHGSPKERKDAVNAWKYYGGVLITTYETYSNLKIDAATLKEVGMVTVDEAHYIKNPEAARSKRIRGLCGQVERVVFLTGTPIENKVDEMLSLLGVLNQPVASEAEAYAQVSTSQQFRDTVAPVYFRRKQCDVNKELPEKIEVIDWCKMSAAEYQAYDDAILMHENPFMPMRRVSWNVSDVENDSSKAKMLVDIVNEAVADSRKVIVFSFFRETIAAVQRLFKGHCTEPIHGSISPAKRQEIIDDFSKNPKLYVLASQIQAGGTGLNIQAASVVVMCEPQIKPSIESQAIARAHRMGQSRNVIVHRLCCEDTIDERMLDILEKKKEQFEVFADKSVAGDKSLGLTDADIKNVIAEEIKNAKARSGKKPKATSFSQSKEGKEWHEAEKAQGQMMYKKIENRGRRRTVGDAQRYRILVRDNFTCQKCGRWGTGAKDDYGNQKPSPPGGYAVLQVDHKNPFSLGGSDDDSNLWTLCERCNQGKGNRYVD